MKCPHVVIAAICLLPAVAQAQVRIGPSGPYHEGKPKVPDRHEPQRMTVIVGPHAAEPQPPLRYALYPRAEDRTAGNSVPYWYRALLPIIRHDALGGFKPFYDNMEAWLDGPIAELPTEDVRAFVTRYRGVFEDARIAALRQDCEWDWRIEQLSGMQSIEFRLEEAQQCRALMRLLALKARVEIADRRYDDAMATMQIGYRLSEDLGRSEIFIAQLVGMAVASITDKLVLDLIRAPESPNLYWALAARPRPLFDLRQSGELEARLPQRMFPDLADAAGRQRSSVEWQTLFREAAKKFGPLTGSREEWPAENAESWQWDLFVIGLGMRAYPGAKRDLTAAGGTPERLEALPVGQVLADHQALDLEHVRQQELKWFYLPHRDSREFARATEDQLEVDGHLTRSPWTGRAILPIAGTLMPAMRQVTEATERAERRLNMLLALEAVRMQIAHDGKLPASLGAVTLVPVVENRFTGEPFPYRVESRRAILELRDLARNARFLDWEVELRLATPTP